jgi:hypothetical protein
MRIFVRSAGVFGVLVGMLAASAQDHDKQTRSSTPDIGADESSY